MINIPRFHPGCSEIATTHWHSNGRTRYGISAIQLRSGITYGRFTRSSHQTDLSLSSLPMGMSSSKLLWSKCSIKNGHCQSPVEEKGEFFPVMGFHNRKIIAITFGCVIIVIMLTKCHYFPIYCVDYHKIPTYLVRKLT